MATQGTVPSEGEVLGGKFRVERVLGQGGMGVVVAATHLVLQKRVALKFLLPEAAGHPEVAERFLREARAASALHSAHVAKVIDVGTLDGGSPYMVMEFLEGHDLEREIQERGVLPVGEAVGHLLQACEALAEAHAAGLVHRDLKPANLFLARQPDGSAMIKVLDFGIAKVTTATGQSLTQTASMMGSPLYMSPEQMTAPRTVDARSDVWALGVTLYEMLTGAWPFEGETVGALSAAILTQAPVGLLQRRPELPGSIEAVIMACLRRDREQRLDSVAALADALAPFAETAEARLSVERVARLLHRTGGAPRRSLPGPAAGASPDGPSTPQLTVGSWAATGPRDGATAAPRRPALIAAGVALLLALPVLGWVAARSRGEGATTATTAATTAAATSTTGAPSQTGAATATEAARPVVELVAP
ncbi:MAG: serine/threonine protein kinase, partial [Myxococcales bacterium]